MVSRVQHDEEHEKTQNIFYQSRIEKYAFQSIAKKALPNERVTICLRSIVSDHVQIWKHLKSEKTFYNGLMICGSVWTCPVCAAKISEKRKNELKTAIDIHKKRGGNLALLTLTVSHKRSDGLVDLLERFSKANMKLMSGKAFQGIRDEMNIIGRVKVNEVTYSDANGFHPHVHIAIFYKNDVDLVSMQKRIFTLWEKACLKHGLVTKKRHGLDLQGAEKLAEYLNKHGRWTLEHEMTKSHIKKGREGSLTPFDFLRNYLETNDEKYLKLFRDYAKAFKGKRQIHWSRGLKDEFGILDKSDEVLATEKSELADLLGILSPEEWQYIYRNEKRAHLLNNIEKYGFDVGVAITLQG